MRKEIEFYRCKHCGNLITFVKASGAPVTCCGEPMTKLEANSTDAATEKHVPVIEKENGNIKVTIGSVLHPMQEQHYIEWIACFSEGKLEFRFLEPNMEPVVEFYNVTSGIVYEHCNIHGLWKAEF